MYKRSRKYNQQYKRKKSLFMFGIISLLIVFVIIIFPNNENKKIQYYTTAGICGCIQTPAVYRLPVGSDIGTLIMHGHGITPNADIQQVDLNQIIQQDSIYHIPSRKEKPRQTLQEIIENSDTIVFQPMTEEKEYSILYVGFPALYFLITYFPDKQRINVVYLPHSTIMLSNEYRLIDVFFTLGINPTKDILEKQLKRKIDYFLIQDRSSFIGMIDELDGIKLPIDTTFAREYTLTAGDHLLDGFLSWEYIRFIDPNSYRAKDRSGKMATLENLQLEMKNLPLAYTLRQERQKKVISSLYSKFKSLNYIDKTKMLTDVFKLFNYNSDISVELALELLPTIKNNTKLQFGTLPGYYQSEGENIYYFPYENEIDLKKKSKISNTFDSANQKTKQILY